MQASCHNPTGMDLGMDEWKEISGVCKSGGLLPFFDMAYQGLGQGIEEDAAAVRLFAEEGHEMVVAAILGTPALKKMWEEELQHMRERLNGIRRGFAEGLEGKRDFRYLLQGRGMFAILGLKSEEIERLKSEYGIYLTLDGRVNLAGLNDDTVDYVAKAILKII